MDDTVNATVVVGDILNATVDNTSETVTVTQTTSQEILNATIVPGTKGEPGDPGPAGADAPSDHTLLTNIGTNTHAQIDTAISNSVSHIANTSNPHSVTKAQVGLSNVPDTDFTADVAANTAKISYTDAAKVAGIEAGAQVNTVTSVNTRTGAVTGLAEASDLTAHTGNTSNPHSVTKAQVGLGNADNTSDIDKPVSTAQATADAAVASTAATNLSAHTTNTSNPHSVTKSQVGLGNADNTSDVNKPISTATQTALDGKVDKTGDVMTGSLTATTLTAGTATDALGTALSVIRNNVEVGRIDNNASGLRVQARNGSLQLRGTGNTGIAIDASGNAVVAGTITGANLSGTNTGDQTIPDSVDDLGPSQTGNSGKFLTTDGTNASWGVPAGSGDVVGPASAVANNVATFDGTTGKIIKDSGLALSGANTGDETQSTIKTKLGAATASVDGYATATQITKLDGIEAAADVTDATNVAAAGAVMDGDFSSNGLMQRTGAGTYAIKGVPTGDIVGTTDTQTLTNKTFDANGTGNALSNVEVADLAASAVVTEAEGLASSDNDTSLPTTAAVKDYVDDRAPTANSVAIFTDQGTTSSSYTNLATVVSCDVTVGPSGVLLVGWGVGAYNTASVAKTSIALSGANTVAANDDWSTDTRNSAYLYGQTGLKIFTGLTPGVTTVTMKFKTAGGTANFFNKSINAVAL